MFPAALPAIFAGLRISAGLSVIGAVVGDFFFGQGESGIGQLLKRYAVQLDGEELLAAVIMTALLGVVVFWTFGWHPAAARSASGTSRRAASDRTPSDRRRTPTRSHPTNHHHHHPILLEDT